MSDLLAPEALAEIEARKEGARQVVDREVTTLEPYDAIVRLYYEDTNALFCHIRAQDERIKALEAAALEETDPVVQRRARALNDLYAARPRRGEPE